MACRENISISFLEKLKRDNEELKKRVEKAEGATSINAQARAASVQEKKAMEQAQKLVTELQEKSNNLEREKTRLNEEIQKISCKLDEETALRTAEKTNFSALKKEITSVKAKNDMLLRDNEEIKKQNQELARRNEEAEKQKQELAKRNEEAEKQKQELARRNEEVEKQKQELAKRNEEVEKQKQELAKRNEEAEKQKQELARLNDEKVRENEEQKECILKLKQEIASCKPIYSKENDSITLDTVYREAVKKISLLEEKNSRLNKQLAAFLQEEKYKTSKGSISNVTQSNQKLSFEYTFSNNINSAGTIEFLANGETIAQQQIPFSQSNKETIDSPIFFNGKYTIRLTNGNETITSQPFSVTDAPCEFQVSLYRDILEVSLKLQDAFYSKYTSKPYEGLKLQTSIDGKITEEQVKSNTVNQLQLASSNSSIQCKLYAQSLQPVVLMLRDCEIQQPLTSNSVSSIH